MAYLLKQKLFAKVNTAMFDIEDSLEEFDIRYMEACNQVNDESISAPYHIAAQSSRVRVDRSDSLSTQTKKLTLSSPLLANKELPNFTCYEERKEEFQQLQSLPPTQSQLHQLQPTLMLLMLLLMLMMLLQLLQLIQLMQLMLLQVFEPNEKLSPTHIFNDYENVSPTNNSHVYTMKPPIKPAVTITSIESLQRPKFKSQSLNSSPLLRRQNSSSSQVLTTSPTNTITTATHSSSTSGPSFRRRATFSQPSTVASTSSVAARSASASVGNPFYKPLPHKKDIHLVQHIQNIHSHASPTSSSYFDQEYDTHLDKKRKISQDNLDTYFELEDFLDFFIPNPPQSHSIQSKNNSISFEKGLTDFFNILDDTSLS